MSKFVGFLFPWRNTFRRLELERRWWHRLAVVAFFIALVPALLFSWAIADNANPPANQFDSSITYWQKTVDGTLVSYDPSSPPPVDNGTLPPPPPPGFGPVRIVPAPVAQKTVRMPNGETVTYPGDTPDTAIDADWQHRSTFAERKALMLGLCWAVLTTLVSSYVLQAGYRALLYVIYGAKIGAAPDTPNAE